MAMLDDATTTQDAGDGDDSVVRAPSNTTRAGGDRGTLFGRARMADERWLPGETRTGVINGQQAWAAESTVNAMVASYWSRDARCRRRREDEAFFTGVEMSWGYKSNGYYWTNRTDMRGPAEISAGPPAPIVPLLG